MKNMKINRLLVALTFIASLAMAGCSDFVDTEMDSPVVPSNSPAVRFLADNQTSYELEPGENAKFTLTVKRNNEGSALQVPITVVTNTENGFVVPDNVSFAAGQATADILVTMSPTAPTGTPLTLELAFADEFVNPYLTEYAAYKGEASLLNWVKFSTGIYTSGFFEASWEQDLYMAEGTNKFRFYDLFVEGVDYNFEWEVGELAIAPAGTANSSGYMVQESGYVHPTHGMVSSATDPDPAYTYYNSTTKTFSFDRQWTVAAGSFGWFTDTYEITEQFVD